VRDVDEQALVVDDFDYGPDSLLRELGGRGCQGAIPEEHWAVIRFDELGRLPNGEGPHANSNGDRRGAVINSHDDESGAGRGRWGVCYMRRKMAQNESACRWRGAVSMGANRDLLGVEEVFRAEVMIV
jgi:hypothetical protein